MAEGVAVFYAAETAIEGAAVGALAVSRPTVPIHVRFHRLKCPNAALKRSSHSINVVKGKAYIFGGKLADSSMDDDVHVVTLPTDLALNDIDYQRIQSKAVPERPLAPYSDAAPRVEESTEAVLPGHRAAHASTVIDDIIYIFGGQPVTLAQETAAPLDESGTVYAFNTGTHTWEYLPPDETGCSQGVPCARTYASAASTSHPLPGSRQDASVHSHGTIFLQGGYAKDGRALRDLWAFDVSSRVWSRWPDLPEPGPAEIAGEGAICCLADRLWRVGDGFGKMLYMDLEQDDAKDATGRGPLGISPKSEKWQAVTFMGESEAKKDNALSDEKMVQAPVAQSEQLPMPRNGAGFVPVTTGAGREYLLYFMGEDGPGSFVRDIWTFQVKSDKTTAAKLKDSIREWVGKASGENTWAKCEVPEFTKLDGHTDVPVGLGRFAFDAWTDLGGGSAVIWGGKRKDGEIVGDGWVVTVQ